MTPKRSSSLDALLRARGDLPAIEVVAPGLFGSGTVRPIALARSPASPLDQLWLDGAGRPRLVDGRATIGPLPAGVWIVTVELEPGRTEERSVAVRGGERARVELE
jgi:hypothetical protein